MMSSYFVQYTAFIDERKRPESFPHYVQIKETYQEIESTDHLKQVVNMRVTQLVTGPGLVVFKDPDEPTDESKITFNRRRFIPWHMITHLEMAVTLISEPNKAVLDTMISVNSSPAKPPESKGHTN